MIDASTPVPTAAGEPPTGPTSERPAVDIVVPFVGSKAERLELDARLSRIALRPGDTVTIADNRTAVITPAATACAIRVVAAAGRPTPGFARNRGAAAGVAPWIVFLDADSVPEADLLDRYFEPAPAEDTAILAGGLRDEPVPPGAPAAARYAHLRGVMTQDDTFAFGAWGYPKSANIACRRSAFESVGGFREDIRAAEDADLTYRLREHGYGIERREAASAIHLSRSTISGLVVQKARWGSGGAWLARQYPGSVPLVAGPGLAVWAVRETIRGLFTAIRRRDRDAAILAVLHPLDALAWQAGRFLSNQR
jgi:GT2 family glycosyltransferase